MDNKFSIVVLISGNGSNLQAIIDNSFGFKENSNYKVSAVICNNPDAYGLIRAQQAGIENHAIDHRAFSSRDQFDAALQLLIDQYAPNLVVLAGFMRLLGNKIVDHFSGRMINIHPSLLPKYPGLHTHRRALEAGDRQHGVSIHYVTNDLDAGPLIAQQSFDIEDDDTEQSLIKRVHTIEHQLYPKVISELAQVNH